MFYIVMQILSLASLCTMFGFINEKFVFFDIIIIFERWRHPKDVLQTDSVLASQKSSALSLDKLSCSVLGHTSLCWFSS